nr:hypothetical protein [Desulfovibrio sp.]
PKKNYKYGNIVEYATHLLSGKERGIEDAEFSRIFGVFVIEKTIKNPLFIIKERQDDNFQDRVKYLSLYKYKEKIVETAIVEICNENDRRIVTNFGKIGRKRDKKRALNKVVSCLNNAHEILYYNKIIISLNRDLSRHLRSPSELGASQGDAPLHTVGKNNLNPSSTDVNISSEENAIFLSENMSQKILHSNSSIKD